jgi:hypothetical protein
LLIHGKSFCLIVKTILNKKIIYFLFKINSLTKDERKRPKYKELLQHTLILTHLTSSVNVSHYVAPYIEEMQHQLN